MSEDHIGRVTIVSARYGGVYETGKWIAFGGWPDDLPDEWRAGDVACLDYFNAHRDEIGGGDTPTAAYEDLLRKQSERRGA
jgi:hypothetical protein